LLEEKLFKDSYEKKTSLSEASTISTYAASSLYKNALEAYPKRI
jgi:hypothetical protein